MSEDPKIVQSRLPQSLLDDLSKMADSIEQIEQMALMGDIRLNSLSKIADSIEQIEEEFDHTHLIQLRWKGTSIFEIPFILFYGLFSIVVAIGFLAYEVHHIRVALEKMVEAETESKIKEDVKKIK